MPVIPSLVLTGQFPGNTYSASLLTSASLVADGLGNQITFLSISCSYAQTASVQTSWEMSSSYASASTWADSSSFASSSISSSNALTSSYFSPSAGAVSNALPITGTVSASGFGFSTAVEFNNFISSLTSSLQSLNTLLADLRSKGLIT